MKLYSLLLQFKNLEVSRSEAEHLLNCNLLTLQCIPPIQIHTSDVCNVILAVQTGRISLQHLIDWVNVVWFSDAFDYADGEDESIASVMNILETLDEPDVSITQHEFNEMLRCLSENQCYDI